MKITKTITVNTTAEKLWQLIGHNFDQAHLWMDPVPHSFGFGEGESSIGAPMEGRICHLSNNPNGAKAKEVLTHFDDANRSLTFESKSNRRTGHCACQKKYRVNDNTRCK